MKSPYRIVSRTITDTERKDGMTWGIALEKIGHEHFDEFENSQMCYYNICKIEVIETSTDCKSFEKPSLCYMHQNQIRR